MSWWYVWCYAVVVFCHSKTLVMARFLLRAQDHNMTNGDFAFFTFWPVRYSGTDRPWTGYLEVSEDLIRRIRAFYAVKQVHAHSGGDLSQILGGPGLRLPLFLLQSFFISFPLVDSPGGVDRARSPAAKHFVAVYTVKQPYKCSLRQRQR